MNSTPRESYLLQLCEEQFCSLLFGSFERGKREQVALSAVDPLPVLMFLGVKLLERGDWQRMAYKGVYLQFVTSFCNKSNHQSNCVFLIRSDVTFY